MRRASQGELAILVQGRTNRSDDIMSKWLFAAVLVLQAHFAASYLRSPG